MTKASDLHNILVAELTPAVPDGDFITQCVFQPLPPLFAEKSHEAGGNVLGLDRCKDDGILFMATALVRTAALRDFAYPKVKAWTQGVKEFAQTIDGGLLDWVGFVALEPV